MPENILLSALYPEVIIKRNKNPFSGHFLMTHLLLAPKNKQTFPTRFPF
jgi:hypothetical protein